MVQKVMGRIWSAERYWSEVLYWSEIIMMLVLIYMVLNVEYCYDFGKIKVELMK